MSLSLSKAKKSRGHDTRDTLHKGALYLPARLTKKPYYGHWVAVMWQSSQPLTGSHRSILG